MFRDHLTLRCSNVTTPSHTVAHCFPLEFVSKMAIDSALEIWFSQLDKATAPTLIATDYLTIIPQARVRCEMVDSQRGAKCRVGYNHFSDPKIANGIIVLL